MNSKPVSGFSCSKCCYVYDTQEKADKCCEEKICSGCGARIGKNFGDYYEPYAYKCKCERIEKINSLPVVEYDDCEFEGVFDPISFNYYYNLEDYIGGLSDEEYNKKIVRVFPAKKKSLEFKMDSDLIEEIISEQIDNFLEDCDERYFSLDDINKLEELEKFMEKWNEKQDIHYFVPDETKVIEVKF